ncbi:MAG: short-chain fatty acid transporter [Candidatus Eremiobacteraeota bacterium]|nr:short-chain fatty acid transporter [Candidatus Eremiobacteraeota bacterium]
MSRLVGALVGLFEQIIPDPYVFAVALTIVTALAAALFAPYRTPAEILTAWYGGIFDILTFAFQMILVLVTGYALAGARPVRALLERVAGLARTPKAAIALTVAASTVACWINWGFGLVAAAILAREIAKRVRMDFGWLVAGAYTGFLVWASGPSSSIALAQATPGSPLNFVQQITGAVLPLRATIFTPFNLVPVLILLVVMPALFAWMAPRPEDSVYADPQRLLDEDAAPAETAAPRSVASILERAWPLNLVLVIAGASYLGFAWSTHGFALDINSVIFIFLLLGLLLHWTPLAYANAVNGAARVTGPLILQYPLYGGIMGMMAKTGLAAVIAKAFVGFSSAGTLPFWSYAASIVISLFVPSGGGHWAVQGPFVVPAAAQLHASQAACAMAVAMGEQVANMIQPFWALPIIAIAGIGIRRVMGFTAVSFVVAFVVYAAALLLLAPRVPG